MGNLVSRMVLLGSGGTFKRWEVLGHWGCPLEDYRIPVLFTCHEVTSFLYHILLLCNVALTEVSKLWSK